MLWTHQGPHEGIQTQKRIMLHYTSLFWRLLALKARLRDLLQLCSSSFPGSALLTPSFRTAQGDSVDTGHASIESHNSEVLGIQRTDNRPKSSHARSVLAILCPRTRCMFARAHLRFKMSPCEVAGLCRHHPEMQPWIQVDQASPSLFATRTARFRVVLDVSPSVCGKARIHTANAFASRPKHASRNGL